MGHRTYAHLGLPKFLLNRVLVAFYVILGPFVKVFSLLPES